MVTLKDVAEASELTVGTVSRVLNNRGYISEKTREKVFRIMKELNYQPNEMARSLSKQTNRTIGVIVPHIEHPYFAKLISCLEYASYKNKYKLLLLNSSRKSERLDEYIDLCKSNRVAGVILCSGSITTEKFKNLHCPLITIERFLEEGTVGIECDNYKGGQLAAEHLIQQGCKKLLHFGGFSNSVMPAEQRTAGFTDYCEKMQVEHYEVYTESAYFNEMKYAELIEIALDRYEDVDGVFANSDVIAAQVIQSCTRRGIKIPEQLKLIGFDDSSIASLLVPKLTTVHQPIEEMADLVFEMLEQAIQGKQISGKITLPVTLIYRETT